MSSFFNKFSKRKSSIDKSSLGSNSSLFSSATIYPSPYSVNEKQLSPFLKAVWRNDLSKVKKFIKKSYNTVDQEKRSAFHLASAAGHLEIIKELISNYSNELLEKPDVNKKTGLFKAVEKGILENVQYIFEKGAKTNVKDDKGDSLIHAAIRHKHSSILQFLLEKELNPNDCNNDVNTPLHVACELDFMEGLQLLMNYSCDVDAQNKLGKTPLILASESGNENAIQILLSNNADRDIKDNEGFKALHYASFHQRIECKKLLQKTEDAQPQVSPPKRPPTLEAPEFIAKLASDNQKSQKSANHKRTSQNDATKSRIPVSDKQNQARKSISQDSIHSNSSWIGDFASTSSDATIPVSRNSIAIHDISTPSSMMNPSDNIVGKTKHVSPGFDNSNLKKQFSDDEESQWSENEKSVKEEIVYPAVLNKPVERKDEVDNKNSESEWDSEDTEQQNVGIELSTIDEESGGKRSRINSMTSPQLVKQIHENEKSELSLPYADDGHQTDSNIEECYNTNYIITTNPPIRYDNVDALDISIDEDSDDDVLNELCTTQVVNKNYKENSQAPSTKPPKSPGVYSSDKNIPTINVQDVTPKKRTHYLNQAGGDNLSYSSTEFDVNSRNGSLAESDSLTDFKKSNRRSLDEYIKKCTHLESKLRSLESEKDCLQMNINAINSSKEKLESERLKIHAENKKIESQLSERIEELEEYKAKFIGAEDQLKKREKELFDIKKSKQEIEDKYNQLEINNLALNSKVKQLNQEMDDLQSQNHEEDSLKQKRQHENELKNLSMTNDNLKSQISNLQHEISKKQEDYAIVTSDNQKNIENLHKEIKTFTQTIQSEKEEKESLQEEIDQLKKTIKSLNSDLESSNKSTALVKKQERENKELKDRIQELEKNCSQLHADNENVAKLSLDKEQKINAIQLEVERLKNQLNLKDDKIYHLETQYKTYENQSKDLEKILERKNSELRESENKLLHLEIELKKEIKKNEDVLNTINDAINTVINDCPDSSELLEKLQNIRKTINSSYGNPVIIHKPVNLSIGDKDLFIELSKSKSQIKVLEEQIEQMKQNYNSEIRSFSNKQNSYEESPNDIENERIDKLEIIERQLHSDLQSKSRIIQTNQHELTQLDKDISQLKEALKEEKQKSQLIQEKDKSLSNQLRNEIKKRKQLSEAIDSVKYWLEKYGKQLNLSTRTEEFMASSNTDTVDNAFSSVPNECSLLLQTLFDKNEDLKMKLKKTELELLELNNRKLSSEKCQEISNGNAQVLLNQQLEEMTQMMENQRLNREKLENIRDENEFQLRNELYQLKQQTMIEVSQFTNKAAATEEEREKLIQQNKILSETLVKERQLKDSLTEQLVNLMKNSHGSNQHINGYESTFHANNFNPSLSQFSIPISLIDNDRKGYANSMINLSVFKPSGVEDDELRQKLRQELDRSIAKHLESGKPIRQLNIKEKIRSLNGGRYPSGIVSWKSP